MAPYLYRHVFRSVKVNGISAALPDIAYLIGSRRVYSRYEQYNPEPIVDTVDEPVADDEVRRKHINSTYKFTDRALIEVKGGRGGDGCVSFECPVPSIKRATGGNGGAGGNVYLVADKNVLSLALQVSHFNAEDGSKGGGDCLTGKVGKDKYVRVPVGTVVTEKINMTDYGEEDIFGNYTEVYDVDPPSVDLDAHGTCILVARGGPPGLGNKALSRGGKIRTNSSTNHKIPGTPGEHKSLQLELKLLADVGLVGFPNAGKSSLLRALSNARPKVASYPFTTLHPHIGMISYSDDIHVSMADIPGIIEGAHENRGLGLDFLRHIERTKILLYVVDGSGYDERTPGKDLEVLIKELRKHDRKLMGKPSLVFLNKIDVEGKEDLHEELRVTARRAGIKVISGSAMHSVGVGELAERLRVMMYEEDVEWFNSTKKK